MRQETEHEVGKVGLVTDDDLARARRDPAFRYQLVADNLRLLLDEINKKRTVRRDPSDSTEIREGVRLAVQLSELLARLASKIPDGSRVV
jgi:hypothetical protein